MKTLTTQITILIFLFLFPSISFSQTFKCEFISEQFKGGKSNKGSCSGDPELTYGSPEKPYSRNLHCLNKPILVYEDYTDFVVNLDNKTIKYTEKRENTQSFLDQFIRYHKNKGDMDREKVLEVYGRTTKLNYSPVILSIQPFIQNVLIKIEGKVVSEKTKSYLITYKNKLLEGLGERMYSLYIPHNGKSIISQYWINPSGKNGDNSWVGMRFGKCVNTSK